MKINAFISVTLIILAGVNPPPPLRNKIRLTDYNKLGVKENPCKTIICTMNTNKKTHYANTHLYNFYTLGDVFYNAQQSANKIK